MGWSIGTGEGGRDIGYGVPAICDYPKCRTEIDRGISFCCGGFRSDDGCGLYFCSDHLYYQEDAYGDAFEFCDSCAISLRLSKIDPNNGWKLGPVGYKPKRDMLKWVIWKIYHDSWQVWRDENPDKYGELKKRELHAPVTSRKLFKQFRDEEGFPSENS